MALVRNKKASFNYELKDRFEAGLVLHGFEVKSVRHGQGKLEGAHVVIRGDEAFLIGADIPPFQKANTPASYESTRTRKLLLSKKEIAELKTEEAQKGQTIVPLAIYNKGRNLKIELAIARGKKKYDKRESIKKKDTKRDVARELKGRGLV